VTVGVVTHAVFAVAHMLVLVVLLRGRRVPGARIIAGVAGLLVADNLILAGGSLLSEGALLEALSGLRFIGHAFVTPLLVLAARALAETSEVRWAARAATRITTVVLTAALVALGVMTDLVGLELAPILEGGILRYHDPSGGAPVAAIVTLVAVLVLAWPMVRRSAGPGPLVGAIVMFVASALDPLTTGPTLGNAGEVALLLGLALGVRGVRQAAVRSQSG
jgi:hypothetical protein